MLMYKKTEFTSLSKWAEGKDYEVTYTIEHTRHDEEIEEINYSNVEKMECKDLEQTMYWVNSFQRQGFQNISICYVVYNKEGQHLLEDIVNDLDITFNTKQTEDTNKRNKQLEKVVNEQEKEIEIFQAFLEKYNAIDLYNKFVESLKTQNEKDGLYWYEYRLRGFSIGCQPKGFVKHDDTQGRHGIIAYDRQLTENEMSNYDLSYWKVS